MMNITNMAVILPSPAKRWMEEGNANVHLDSLVNDVKVRCLIPLPRILCWPFCRLLTQALLISTF